MRGRFAVAVLCAVALVAAGALWAQQVAGDAAGKAKEDYGLVSGGDEPIHFASDEFNADHKAGWVRLNGNVVVTQGASVLNCDELEIRYSKQSAEGTPGSGGERIREVIATGHVRMNQEDRNATCENAHYFAENRTVVLTGEPVVWQGEDRLAGKRIEIFLDTDRVRVTGDSETGEKVRIVVNPKEGGSLLDALGRTPDKEDGDGDASGE